MSAKTTHRQRHPNRGLSADDEEEEGGNMYRHQQQEVCLIRASAIVAGMTQRDAQRKAKAAERRKRGTKKDYPHPTLIYTAPERRFENYESPFIKGRATIRRPATSATNSHKLKKQLAQLMIEGSVRLSLLEDFRIASTS